MASSASDAAPQPPPPPAAAHYDKFGFLVAPNRQQERASDYEPRSNHSNSRDRDRDRNRDRDRSRGRSRSRERERGRYRRRSASRSRSPAPRRRRRYSRSRSRSRSRSPGERPPPAAPPPPPPCDDNWGNAPPPPAAPYVSSAQPSYPPEPIAAAYTIENNYGQFGSGYNNFSDVGPPQMATAMHIAPEMSMPLNAPPQTWNAQIPSAPIMTPNRDEHSKREAIASELRNQRATLIKQREEYMRKASNLKRELESLKEQKAELRGDGRRSPSPNTQRFLKENIKLQSKLQNKLKTMDSVIDMLNGIIENNPVSVDIGTSIEKMKSKRQRSKSKSPSESSSSDNEKSARRAKIKPSTVGDKKFNYAYYDPEMHWCRICNEFPATAKDYLTHLHTSQHHKAAAAHMEAPWHSTPNLHEGFPNYPGAPLKRTPIKGLQFFVPSTAWYCKLCDQWIGDLHCASAHLKSILHAKNYTNFVELNPHWEMDWMSDRQKSFEKCHKNLAQSQESVEKTQGQYSPHTISFQGDTIQTKSKKSESQTEEDGNLSSKLEQKKERKKKEKKEKKKTKKKRSQSESSGSSQSSTDNKIEQIKKLNKQENEDVPNEDVKKENDADDRLLNQWMCVQDTSEQDRKMLEEVKNRVKSRAGERIEQSVDGRVVSREREARALLSIHPDVRMEALNTTKPEPKEKEREKETDRDRDRDKEKQHRDRDRNRDRDRDRNRDYDRNRGRNRSRDRDRTRSRDHHRHSERERRDRKDDKHHRTKTRDSDEEIKHRKSSSFMDKSHHFQESEFRPYSSSKNDSHDHNETQFDKQVSKNKKDSNKDNSKDSSTDPKKMPFIGKMPLYKSLGSKPSKNENDTTKLSEHETIEVARKKRDEINAQLMESFKEQFISSMAKKNEAMEAQMLETKYLIPGQYPPFTDMTEIVIPRTPLPIDINSLPKTIHRIQPPVVYAPPPPPPVPIIPQDTTKPATTSKDGSLHKDFQDALDIIFPSEAPPKEEGDKKSDDDDDDANETAASTENPASTEHEVQYVQSDVTAEYQQDGYQTMTSMMPGIMTAQGYMPQTHMGMGMMMGYDYSTGLYEQMYDMSGQTAEVQPPIPASNPPKSMINNQDMEDLAMLGIDAEDVGAGGF